MPPKSKTEQALLTENAQLRTRLEETEETLRAIRDGEVDAIIVGGQLYMLERAGTSSNRFHSEVLAQINDAVVAVDNDMRVIYFNPAAERQYRVTAAESLGRLLNELYEFRWLRPEDEAACLATLEATGSWRGENIHIRRDGTRVHVESVVNRLRDENGAATGMLAVIRDISERKRAEAARAQLVAIVESSADAIYSCDFDFRILNWNKGAEKLYGWTAEEIIGQPVTIIIPLDLVDETLNKFNSALKYHQPVVNLEAVRRRRDGSYIDVQVTASPIKDAAGKPSALSIVARDITQRKRAEDALRASQARIAADLQAMTTLYQVGNSCVNADITSDQCLDSILKAAISITRADKGNIQLLDPESGSLVIAAHRGFEEPFLNFFAHVHHNNTACGTALQTGGRVIVEDVRQSEIFAGQPSLDVLLEAGVRAVQSTPLMNSAGKLLGMISTHFAQPPRLDENELRLMDLLARQAGDFLERKQAEEALRIAYEKESAARAEAEAANRAKDDFLAIVSHELRSPLTAILGYNRMLREKPGDLVLLKTSCEIIERNARQQLQLIEDLLDTTRIVSGKLRLEIEQVDIYTVLAETIDEVRPVTETKGIDLSLKLNLKHEMIHGDGARLRQVVWNLLSNAIKFTPDGGLVELRAEQSGERVRIIISDTGKGIEPQFLPYIFDRFRQADGSASRRHAGLGLGLALVKHLVELHGGEVTAASEGTGRGSIFTVTLPLAMLGATTAAEPSALNAFAAPDEVKTESAIPQPDGLMITGVRVLAVDDHDEARAMITTLLSKRGAIVTALSSGAEALAFLSALPNEEWPEVLVCDIAMPDEDGYSLLARVRALERDIGIRTSRRIPAIALTALARSKDRLRALSAGFQMHIAKPVDPAELIVVIASVVGKRNNGKPYHKDSPPPGDSSA
jgi:PAS domain S-box-containing protein